MHDCRFLVRQKVALLILFSGLVTAAGHGKHFQYHHASPLALGVGVNLADPSEPQRRCLEFHEERMDGEAARKSEIKVRVVTSKKELFQTLGVSASVAAQSFFVNGDAGVSFANEASFEEDSLVWVLYGTVDFGRVRAKDAKLKTFAQKLLDENRHEDFRKQCGMSYVSQEKRGATVFALYTLRNLSHKEKEELSSYLNVNVETIFVDAQLEFKFKRALSEFQRNKQLSFRVEAIGGEGISTLSNVVQHENDIEKIREIVANYLGRLTIANAVPMEFLTSTFEQFGWEPQFPFNWNKRDLVLSEYYFSVGQIQAERERLRTVIDSRSTDYAHLSEESIQSYEEQLQGRNDALEKLFGEAESCVADPAKCTSPKTSLIAIAWPRTVASLIGSSRVWRLHIPEITHPTEPTYGQDKCERERIYATRIGCVDEDDLRELRLIGAAPLCSSTGELVSLVYCK